MEMNLKDGAWPSIKVSRCISQLRASKNTVSFENEALGEGLKIFDL